MDRRAYALATSGAKTRTTIVVVVALALSGFVPDWAHGQGFVTRSGDRLLLDGSDYRFTGFNVYNANSRGECGPAMSTGSTLDDALTAMGTSSNAIRSWFFQSLATTGGERDWSGFDHTLAVARSHGFKVIATLTNQFGDCEVPDGFKDQTWYTTGYRELDPAGTVSYRDWVAEVVSRYKDDPTILGWQLLNEAEVQSGPGAATCPANAEEILKSFTTDVSGLVKSIDPNHLTSLGTIGSGQCGAEGVEYQDLYSLPTIDLCEYHDYNEPTAPMPGDEFNGLALRIDQCEALQKPLFVGETGIVPNAVGGLAARAEAFDAKFDAQFAAGVVGELVWAWSTLGSTLDDYDVGAGDPTIDVLGRYATGSAPRAYMRIPLVPAYVPCTDSNRTHGAPFDRPSCAPPVQESSHLTLGTPGANGAPASSIGYLRLRTKVGVPGPPSASDVLIDGEISDVRCQTGVSACGSENSSGGPDYTGELEIRLGLRLTDEYNGVTDVELADPATVADTELPVIARCSETPSDPKIGGRCEVSTSANALLAGSVLEGKQAFWALDQVRVYDGGTDGVVTPVDDSSLFETQGLFVP